MEARNLLAWAAEIYHQQGDFDECLSATLNLGQIYLIGTKPDRDDARKIFQHVQVQALAAGNNVRQAEAALRIAELDFDDMLARRAVEPGIQVDHTPYHHALTLYKAAEHALGPADVLLSLGRRLISAGFDGSNALHKALNLYTQEDNLTGINSTLSALGTWYLQRGELAMALDCHQQAAEVAKNMCFPLGQATAYMGIGDYFYRTGDYARAFVAYEKVEAFAAFPAVRALVNLVLANAYTLMNLHDRAEATCRAAIAALILSGPNDRLSLAHYILGNVLGSKGDWTAAILTWNDGLAVDKAINNRLGQAEKLQCIAQAIVMQHYYPGGPPIPDAAYKESIILYTQAIALLREIGSQQAAAAIAGAFQLQGQTAVTCGRFLDALHYLEQGRNDYADLGLAMQTATTDVLLGLLCHALGGRGYPDLYVESARCQERALDYFQAAGMLEMTWKVRFHLAHTAFWRGLLAITNDEQQTHWQNAASWLEDADDDIEMVRGRFIEANPIARESARLGLVTDKEKVYTFAVQLHFLYLKSTKSAFNWLERLKGRVFLDALSLTPLHSSTLIDVTLIDNENELLRDLNNASTQTQVVDLNERLHALWDRMATDPVANEYLTMRRSEPVNWETIKALLQPLTPEE
jgi:tetratricopeptide (TPR) repeat protein